MLFPASRCQKSTSQSPFVSGTVSVFKIDSSSSTRYHQQQRRRRCSASNSVLSLPRAEAVADPVANLSLGRQLLFICVIAGVLWSWSMFHKYPSSTTTTTMPTMTASQFLYYPTTILEQHLSYNSHHRSLLMMKPQPDEAEAEAEEPPYSSSSLIAGLRNKSVLQRENGEHAQEPSNEQELAKEYDDGQASGSLRGKVS